MIFSKEEENEKKIEQYISREWHIPLEQILKVRPHGASMVITFSEQSEQLKALCDHGLNSKPVKHARKSRVPNITLEWGDDPQIGGAANELWVRTGAYSRGDCLYNKLAELANPQQISRL